LVHAWGLVKYCAELHGTTIKMMANTAQADEAAMIA
jgi:hypothetical protein